MISFSLHFVGIFILFSAFVYDIVGSSNQSRPGGGEQISISSISSDPQNNSQEFCNFLLEAKTSLLLDFQHSEFVLPNSFVKCDVSDNCSSLTCRALVGEDKVKAGINFRLCDSLRGIGFWVDKPKLWKQKWSYLFPIEGDNYDPVKRQRVEINRKLNIGLEHRFFIKVVSFMVKNQVGEEYLSLKSMLQICETESENSCENKTLLNLFQHPVRLIPCDVSKYSNTNMKLYEFSSLKNRSSRSSRSVWNPEELHSKNNTPDNLGVGSSSHNVGQSCDTSDIFSCGDGAGCVNSEAGQGVCKCLNDFVSDSAGRCLKKPADSPSDPPSQPVNTTSSYSTALGALFSVFILLSLAASVFFGTKYHVFSRIRNRLPLNLRCWPWPVLRRSSPLEDNVSMVNPIDQDDDEPLLL